MSQPAIDRPAGMISSLDASPVVSASLPSPSLPSPSSIPARYALLLEKLARADRELGDADSGGRTGAVEEASALVFDLLYALDFRHGGEMVPRLAALYGYIGNELLNIGRSGDRESLAHIRDMIETLRDSW